MHRLQEENPDKVFIPGSAQAVCPYMKMIRLEDVKRALEKREYEVKLPDSLIQQAVKPIREMLALSR